MRHRDSHFLGPWHLFVSTCYDVETCYKFVGFAVSGNLTKSMPRQYLPVASNLSILGNSSSVNIFQYHSIQYNLSKYNSVVKLPNTQPTNHTALVLDPSQNLTRPSSRRKLLQTVRKQVGLQLHNLHSASHENFVHKFMVTSTDKHTALCMANQSSQH